MLLQNIFEVAPPMAAGMLSHRLRGATNHDLSALVAAIASKAIDETLRARTNDYNN
jgi:hypothetical protein